ncbi:hypothetical protein GKC30_12515 [Pseudodesulfovibrio sp. F-1]|uniref:Uncharacterized protein n=1 Tax=Pseudodesulfovibrio alkaliphilus TaxID=2661613 RepID=A0A7K1KQU2_9BACT|nr:hypothetical protein [Pseudodesulfovibrio alkaliphilus]MUM78458.1 hypothetical protein [Pseudodesulfovibrio alkaliphilus]
MADFSEYADQLQKEVVFEIAEGYFGDRRNLDDLMADFATMTGKLRELLPGIERAALRLHHLLLGNEASLYLALEVDPACIPFGRGMPLPLFTRIPLALTRAGRYVKCVRKSYDLLQRAVHDYLHGHYHVRDGDGGRKQLTVNYLGLRQFAAGINAEVGRVNRNRTPTGTLRYVKGMDPVNAERERLIGDVSYMDDGALDNDLRFAPVEFEILGLPEIQELPPLREAAGRIGRMSRALFGDRPGEAQAAMNDLLIR